MASRKVGHERTPQRGIGVQGTLSRTGSQETGTATVVATGSSIMTRLRAARQSQGGVALEAASQQVSVSVSVSASASTDAGTKDSAMTDSGNNSAAAAASSSSSSSSVGDEFFRHLQNLMLPPQEQRDVGKLTVVLDIDETLIHAVLPEDAYRQEEARLEAAEAAQFQGDTIVVALATGETFQVNIRPGLSEFLQIASEKYELIAYTAAAERYAKPLIDRIDPENRFFRHRLYRNHCIPVNGLFVKDLRFVNRPLDRVVLVDNNFYCFMPQLANGIPIVPFYNQHGDNALQQLQEFLCQLDTQKTVQPALRMAFNLEVILREERERLLGGIGFFVN